MTQPWKPVEYEDADVSALKALMGGHADEDQQKRAFKWILEGAAGLYDMSYYPGGEEGRRDTDFAEGRRFVGNQILKVAKVRLDARRKE